MYLPGGLIGSAGAQTVSSSFDYYIGPKGSDSNPGTLSQPWAITAINTKRSTYAGKTVGILDGTYDLVVIMGQPTSAFDTGSLVIAAGSSGSPTIIQAVNARQAVIDWNRNAVTNGSAGSSMQPGGDYVTIDGLVFTNNNYRVVVNYTGGGSHFTVKNCLFQNQSYTVGATGANSNMIYTQGHDDILISNCRFVAGGAPVDGGRHACIQTYQATHRVTIEYCTFIAGTGTGNLIHFKQADNFTPIVRYCHMDRSASTNSTSQCVILLQGELTDGTDSSQFHHNVMIAGGGYVIFDADGGYAGTYNIYNNDFIGPWNNAGCFAHMDSGNPTQTNIYNNIWYRSSGGAGQYGDVTVRSIATLGTMDYNYYPSSSPVWGGGPLSGTTYPSLAVWQIASSKDAHSTTGSNPLFVGSGVEAAYYKLQVSSPCKTLGAGGIEIGAWSGASQVGCSFGGGVVPLPPRNISVS